MQFQASKHLKLLLFFILSLHFQSLVTAEELAFHFCGSSNYTSGSQYDTNLNAILPTLSRNGVIRHDSFYNNSYGDGANTVYGYSQCMSGASEDVCRQCLINSTAEIIRGCPDKTEATIRYYNCILRYSYQHFFSILNTTTSSIILSIHPLQNVSDVTLFNTQAGGLMNGIATAAASAVSKYAVNFTNYDSFGRIYGLAQCTRDLSESNCGRCLRRMIENIPTCCDGRTGGHVYSVSCNIRYDMYIFYSLTPPAPPPPRPPVAADSPTPTPGSPIIDPTQGTGKKRRLIAIGFTVTIAGLVLLGCCIFHLLRRRRKPQEARKLQSHHALLNNLGATSTDLLSTDMYGGSQGENQELPFIDFGTIQHSTNNFSSENKLGQGGFGIVYKGMLADGKEIAVKRLSIGSSQGLKEFKNEVILISKLQHKNLVRLLFCCMEKEEKLLIYEYMPNKSLDFFLFEILSGRKNSRSYLAENAQSLLAYAWRLWCDQKVLELIDPILIDSCPMDEVLRFVHLGLLCIQEDAADRPTMSSVVLMLGSKYMTLPHPSEPPLYVRKREITSEESSSNAKTSSNNEVTISEVEPR